LSQCTRQTDIILWTQNIQNEVLFPAQKLTSEENLLVGVESVDDEGEELVDISREGVAFSVGGLLAEGRGIRKNVWRVARKTGTSAVRCCVVKNYEREDNEGHEMHNPQSSWQESRARGWIWLGQEGPTNLLTTATRHTADHQSSHWHLFSFVYARQEVKQHKMCR